MSCEGIEVQIEPITGKKGDAARSQSLSQRVDEQMSCLLRARTELKHRDHLGEGIDGEPEPQDLFGATQPGAQFVQLQVREVQVAEAALMEELSVPACASEPDGDGGLTVPENPFGGGSIQPFGQRRQDHGDLMRGRFQTVQGRMASSTERSAASLTTKGLDWFSLTMLAITNQGVDGSVCYAKVEALLVGTGQSLRLGAPRRLLTSLQGRTVRGDGPAPAENGEDRQQTGQSRGVRGLSRRWTNGCTAPVRQWARPLWGKERQHSHARESMRMDKSTNR